MKHAFMIAATGSGCGKTTITCVLLQALINQKKTVRSFKCGPDYIDPMFHRSVLGICSENLDSFFSSKQELQTLFYENNRSEVSVVEGVMGLYDGIRPENNEGSSYELACELKLPVILVVNARGMGRSLLAVIKGFQAMDEQLRIKGVILNQISPYYYKSIQRLVEAELGIPVVGYVPRLEALHLESRHLGLKLPKERENLQKDLCAAAEIVETTIDWNQLWEISKLEENGENQKRTKAATNDKETRELPKVRIGVAYDEAFCFYYEENLKLLERFGAELVPFSPVRDQTLPENLDGLLLGGGYPELYAKELSENESMRCSIHRALEKGMPSLAECGGFMYLHDTIVVDSMQYPMVGAIAGKCVKQDKLVRFGYVVLSEKSESFLSEGEGCIKGHEFHYYDSTDNGADAIASKPNGIKTWESSHITDNHWWGFTHLYYPSNDAFVRHFIDKCLTLHLQ